MYPWKYTVMRSIGMYVHLVQCSTKECEEHIQLVQWQVGLVKKSNYTIVEIQEYKNMYPTNTHRPSSAVANCCGEKVGTV